jgi:putative tributyrin esterase
MNAIVPQPTPEEVERFGPKPRYQTLYLLHGLSDDHTIWMRRTSIERYAEEKRLAVVMPAVDRSFYTDMVHGNRYWSFISDEVPRVARAFFSLSDRREDNFAAGLSMGGYGAFKLALGKPESFAAAASLSGAIDLGSEIAKPDEKPDFFENIFGPPKAFKGSDNDLPALLTRLKKSGKPIPRLYQCCGTEDFLYTQNTAFRETAKKLGVDLTYREGPGAHTWAFWDEYIQYVLDWLPLKKEPVA